MALSQSLPLFNSTRKFVTEYAIVYEKMKCLHKYHVGAYIYDRAIALNAHIVKANRLAGDMPARAESIQDYIDDVSLISYALRVAHDIRAIDTKSHARLSVHIEDLSKQALAWRKKSLARFSESTDSGRDAELLKGRSVETPKTETTYG